MTLTKDKLDNYYGDYAPSILIVTKWFTEFRPGRTTSDAERSHQTKKNPRYEDVRGFFSFFGV